MARFILTKSHDNNFIVKDELGIVPLLFFTDLTIALKCKAELNRICNVKENVINYIGLKETGALSDRDEHLRVNNYYRPEVEERIRVYRELQDELKERI